MTTSSTAHPRQPKGQPTGGQFAAKSNPEADFVAVAREYATQKRIGYKAWRSVGVPAAVLKRAGIAR